MKLGNIFHKQLKILWDVHPPLRNDIKRPQLKVSRDVHIPAVTIVDLSKKHSMYGFNFVPLVTEELSLLCSVEILMLRNQKPGSIMETGDYGGDIDNRVKTLLDALSLPRANENYVNLTTNEGERPFFCLLEDDKLITKVVIETDHLLDEIPESRSVHDVRLIITVKIRPYDVNLSNLHFGG
jgi:hypothetical protein